MELAFILLILGAGAALKSGWDHVNSERRIDRDKRIGEREKSSGRKMTKSQRSAFARRHGAGWLAREVAGGFPVTRTGVHAGWLAHKTASMHSRHLREEARTTSDELRASFAPALAEHRKRQKAARDEIVRVCDYSAPPRDRRKAMREAADAVVLHPDFPAHGDGWMDGGAPGDPEDEEATSDLPWPDGGSDNDHITTGSRRLDGEPETDPERRFFDTHTAALDAYGRPVLLRAADDLAEHLTAPMPDPRLNDAQRERDGRGQRNICAACGHPGTADNPLVISDGYRVHETHKTDPESGLHGPDWPAGIPHRRRGDASPATEGNAMPTGTAETTYDQTVAEANGIIAECEQEIARLRTRRIAAKVEQMASAGLDSGSLSRAMEIDEALKAQEKAAQQALDAAQAFRDGLQRDHGAMNEAHQSAPVVGAQPEFYAG